MKTFKKFTLVIVALIAILFTNCTTNPKEKQDNSENAELDTAGLTLPDGFSAIIVADDLGRGRHITASDNGDLYVSLRRKNNDGGIVALRDTTGDGVADIIKYFGEHEGTGIGLHKGYLYSGADYGIYRYKLNEGELLPENNAELIVGGFPDQSQHEVKPFAFDNNGNIYVNVGAPSNACMEQMRTKGSPGQDPCEQLIRHAGIWQFKDDVPDQDQMRDGYHYATGMRNSVALEWNNNTDELYVVMHGRDQLHQFFPEMYTEEMSAELPSEEFLLVKDGSDFGWPYCYYDHLKEKKVLAPEYGGDGETIGRCEEKDDPILGFPGHLAPNDLIFYKGDQFPEKYKKGAFIAFHGSWNRGPLEQQGYYVIFVPLNNEGLPAGDWEVFADGFKGDEPVMNTGDAEYRPCGLEEGPDGSLYVVDSNKGRVWKIMYNG